MSGFMLLVVLAFDAERCSFKGKKCIRMGINVLNVFLKCSRKECIMMYLCGIRKCQPQTRASFLIIILVTTPGISLSLTKNMKHTRIPFQYCECCQLCFIMFLPTAFLSPFLQENSYMYLKISVALGCCAFRSPVKKHKAKPGRKSSEISMPRSSTRLFQTNIDQTTVIPDLSSIHGDAGQ